MRIALIQGYFSTQTRGPYDVANLHKHDLSGSESFYFNMVRGLAEAGHRVEAHGFWTSGHETENIKYIPFDISAVNKTTTLDIDFANLDAAIGWNEPDVLAVAPESVKRICLQQLNDFYYCNTDFKKHTDLFLFPSQKHLEYIVRLESLDINKCAVLSNCISNEDNFREPGNHKNKKIVYCSSPDRGLHWFGEFFPKVRQRIPDAELHVFYRLDSWLARFTPAWEHFQPNKEFGYRARYIAEFIRRWGQDTTRGLYLHGPVSNKVMADTLLNARVLAYPCDTANFTEGFGVSVLDACAAGAFPLISDVDAFGSVYGDTAHVINGRPADNRTAWVDTLCRSLEDDELFTTVTNRCKDFAKKFTRASRTQALVKYIEGMGKA